MHIVASDLIAADLATELELSLSEANQYLDSLEREGEEEWAADLDNVITQP
jgi:hypothetical protein